MKYLIRIPFVYIIRVKLRIKLSILQSQDCMYFVWAVKLKKKNEKKNAHKLKPYFDYDELNKFPCEYALKTIFAETNNVIVRTI